jgi:hypothetical protein
VIILDVPPHARVYRALPTSDQYMATELNGDVVLIALEHYEDLVARVALAEAASQLGCPGLTA